MDSSVHSILAKERANKSSKKFDKLVEKEIKAFDSLKLTLFACEDDANRALTKLAKKFSLLAFTDSKIVKHKRYKKAGQPKKNQEPDFYVFNGLCLFRDENSNFS